MKKLFSILAILAIPSILFATPIQQTIPDTANYRATLKLNGDFVTYESTPTAASNFELNHGSITKCSSITANIVTVGKLVNSNVAQYDSTGTFTATQTATRVIVSSGVQFQDGSFQNVASYVQIVSSQISVSVSQVASGYSDSKLTATITPKYATSKIYVVVSQYVSIHAPGGGTNMAKLKLLRDASTLADTPVLVQNGTTPALHEAMISLSYLDSPASTSALVYKTQIGSNGVATSIIAQNNPGGIATTSTITLIEIR